MEGKAKVQNIATNQQYFAACKINFFLFGVLFTCDYIYGYVMTNFWDQPTRTKPKNFRAISYINVYPPDKGDTTSTQPRASKGGRIAHKLAHKRTGFINVYGAIRGGLICAAAGYEYCTCPQGAVRKSPLQSPPLVRHSSPNS